MRSSVELFRALADETRLRILNLLAQGELCVCDIVKVLHIGQSKASRHLAYLRNSGLVNDRREGGWMHYSLATPTGFTHGRILEWLSEAATEFPQVSADLKALHLVQCRARRCSKRAGGSGKLVHASAERG